MFHLSTKLSRYENNIIVLNILNTDSPCSYLKISVTLYSNNLKNIITTPRLRKLTTLPFHKAPSGTKKYKRTEEITMNHSKRDVTFADVTEFILNNKIIKITSIKGVISLFTKSLNFVKGV